MSTVSTRFSQPQFLPLSLARAIWKHKTLVVLLCLALTGTGVAISRRLPALYKAEALILVDPQKVPERFVTSTVTDDLQDRLATISQEIQSTPRLEGIINELGLYRSARRTHGTEEIIGMMRKDIDVKVEKGRAFRISYVAPDPQTATRVVDLMTKLYIDQNLKSRETQAAGTTEFIDTQLQEAKQTLVKLETAVSQYKVAHNGELPEQETSLGSSLSRLQMELQGNQDATNRAQQEKVALESSLAAARSTEASLKRASQVRATVAVSGTAQPASDATLAELETELAQMRERYTDDYPEVVQMKTKISLMQRARIKANLLSAKLQEQAAREPAPKEPAVSDVQADSPLSSELTNARERIFTLQSQLAATNHLIAQEVDDRGRIIAMISANEGRIGQLPLREQELASLTRDYQISKNNYQTLLDKKILAEMAGDLERRQKAERFRILDPAKAPDRPFKPNRALLYAGSFLAGLLVSLATAIGWEWRRGVFLGEWELPKDIPVLGVVPDIGPPTGPAPDSRLIGGSGRTLELTTMALPKILAALSLWAALNGLLRNGA